MKPAARGPWWRGARGEWYVIAQFVLIALVLLGPRSLPGMPSWPPAHPGISRAAGAVLAVAGGCLLAAGFFSLGRNLTPLPYPKEQATLVVAGPYRFVRHPMYAALILLAFGWALAVRGWPNLVAASALAWLLDVKAAREERWLVEKHPGYREYQGRVKKLVPFIY